jgi:hypothetical protein
MLAFALDVSTYPLYPIYPYIGSNNLVTIKDFMNSVMDRFSIHNILKFLYFYYRSQRLNAAPCLLLGSQVERIAGVVGIFISVKSS